MGGLLSAASIPDIGLNVGLLVDEMGNDVGPIVGKVVLICIAFFVVKRGALYVHKLVVPSDGSDYVDGEDGRED